VRAISTWRSTCALACALVVVLTGCSSNSSGGASDEGPIKFGILTEKTGPQASLSPDKEFGVKAGVALATNGTNEVAGRKIEFIVGDDRSDVAQAPTVARRIVQQDHPAIMFGFSVSDAAVATAPIMADAEIPDIYTVSSTTELSNFADTTFRTSRDSQQEARMFATVARIKQGETFQILAPDLAFGQATAEATEKLLMEEGGEPAGDIIYAPLEAEDYTAAVERVRQRSADQLMVVTFTGPAGARLWQTIGRAGIADDSEMYTLLQQRPVREGMGPIAQDVNFFALYDPELVESDLNSRFIEEFEKLSGGTPPDIYAADAGTAGIIAVEALKETGGDTDPAKISAALEGMEGEGIRGEFSLRAEDHVFLQPFFEARLDDSFRAELVRAYPPEAIDVPVYPPKERRSGD
jgi:branched-chain amino acid transport system substrate-binding protein